MLIKVPSLHMGFPGGSVGKESACNAGDPSSIPVSGRSTGEGEGICPRVHSLCCVCYRFCQMHDDAYPPFWYHIEYLTALKIPCAPSVYPFL